MDYPKRLSKDLPRLLQAFREYEGPPSHVKVIIDRLEDIMQTWKMMEAMFKDEEAGENIFKISGEVKLQWLRELRDLAWEMDRLVDIYDYKLVEIQLEEAETYKRMKMKGKAGGASMIMRWIASCIPTTTRATSSPIADASFRQEMEERMFKINKQYKGISENYMPLMQVSNSEKEVPRRKWKISEWREPTGHLLVHSHQFLGRNEELSRLKEMLNCSIDDVGDHKVEVIAVVGMGGVGKTTLVQHAYKAANEFGFDKTGWVFTSEDLGFDVLRLTKDAIESFGAKSSSSDQLSVHQNDLMSIIKGNKFLLVVDDLWKISSWEKFLAPFVQGGAKKGSRILVTSRSPDVAKVVLEKNSNLHINLDYLSEIDGWSLLKEIIFGSGNELATAEQYKDLIAIGKQISLKCKGLPLAIKMTGNLLRQVGEDDKEKWMQIRDSGLWDQHLEDNSEKKRMVLGSLRLSYTYMPPDLRVFFKCLAMLSKGEKISRERLISIWMIYGALDYSSEEDVSRINADKIINDLVSWAFLIKRVDFSYLRGFWDTMYEMHDLIHDLALEVCGEEFKSEKIESEYSADSKARIMSLKLSSNKALVVRATRVRLLSAHTYHAEILWISDAECLRSLCLYGFQEIHWNQDCIDKMNHLHVLEYGCPIVLPRTPEWIFHQYNLHSLCISGVKAIPDAIEDLKNLRFLKLEYIADGRIPEAVYTLINLRVLMILATPVSRVSESISSLVNLQQLQIDCSHLREELPRGITELTQLRLMSLLPNGAFLPTGISKLTNLRQLSNFKLCNCSLRTVKYRHAGLDELEKLNQLNGDLRIFNFRYARTQDVQATTILSIMKNLHMLDLNWGDTGESTKSQNCVNNIRSLFINDFLVNSIQSWMGNPSLNEIVKIRLSYSPMCTLSPLAHLPSLKSLKIEGDIHFDIADSQTEGCSTSIRDQSPRSFFPQLQILSIWSCPSLRVIPLYKFNKLSGIVVFRCKNFYEIELEGGLSVRSVTPDGESSPPIHLAIAECDGSWLTPEMQKRIEVSHCQHRIDLLEREHSLSGDLFIPPMVYRGDLFKPVHPDTCYGKFNRRNLSY